MSFNVTGSLLEACVLGALENAPTYGYDLTQKIQMAIDVSESTLYPVLRRLTKDGMLETYDEPFDGRNRRYYKITGRGEGVLKSAVLDWNNYKQSIDDLLNGIIKGGEEHE